MQKIRPVALLLSAVLTGCVSSSDHDRLKHDLARYKTKVELHQRDCDKKVDQLVAEMMSFRKAYSEELHQQLTKNLAASEKSYKKALEIQKNMEKLEQNLIGMSNLAERNCETIKKNARTSTTENVVNEFESLKRDWSRTISDVKERAKTLQGLVDKSNELVIKAQSAAIKATEDSRKVTEYEKKITELQAATKCLESELAKHCKEKKPEQKDLDMLFELYKNLNNKVDGMTKK